MGSCSGLLLRLVAQACCSGLWVELVIQPRVGPVVFRARCQGRVGPVDRGLGKVGGLAGNSGLTTEPSSWKKGLGKSDQGLGSAWESARISGRPTGSGHDRLSPNASLAQLVRAADS